MDNNLLTTLYYASVGAKKEKEKKKKRKERSVVQDAKITSFTVCILSFLLHCA
jgi:hypothetical protein